MTLSRIVSKYVVPMKKYVMSVITIGLTLLTVLPLVTRLATTDVIAIVINACSAILTRLACLAWVYVGLKITSLLTMKRRKRQTTEIFQDTS